jgi:hypothetical protein
MYGTFPCPDTCGFAKVAALEIEEQIRNTAKENSELTKGKENEYKLKQEQYRQFNTNFNNKEDGKNNFEINFTKYNTNLIKLRSIVRKWNFRKSNEKRQYLDTFSLKQWKKLSEERKSGKLQGVCCEICCSPSILSSQITVFERKNQVKSSVTCT